MVAPLNNLDRECVGSIKQPSSSVGLLCEVLLKVMLERDVRNCVSSTNHSSALMNIMFNNGIAGHKYIERDDDLYACSEP